MKSVLISIQPKWCELIAQGKKTVEVRKTKPKLDVPFKCYIYATQPKKWFRFSSFGYASDESLWLSNGKVKMSDGFEFWADETEYCCLNGKVIGEFVCDKIDEIYQCNSGWVSENACISKDEFFDYLGIPRVTHMGYDKKAFAWHISNLAIYDKPKELGEFNLYKPKKCASYRNGVCSASYRSDVVLCENLNCILKSKGEKPPQSWCYVEEMGV